MLGLRATSRDQANTVRLQVVDSLPGCYKLQAAIDKMTSRVGVCAVSFHADEALNAALATQPDVIFINHSSIRNAMQLARSLASEVPSAGLVIGVDQIESMGGDPDAEGTTYSVVQLPLNKHNGARAVHAILRAGQHPSIEQPKGIGISQRSLVIYVQSGKGGVGKSLIAANLSVLFAQAGNRVCLVDLDLQYGNAGAIATPRTHGGGTILDLIDAQTVNVDGLFRALVDGLPDRTLENPTGLLRILRPPQHLAWTEFVTPQHLAVVLETLREQFNVIVIDSASYLEERTLVAVAETDWVVLVTSTQLTSLENTRRVVDFLSVMQEFDVARVQLAVNQITPYSYTSLREVEQTIGLPVITSLPYASKIVERSIAFGKPFVLEHPKALITERLTGLASRLVPLATESGSHAIRKWLNSEESPDEDAEGEPTAPTAEAG